MLTKVTRGLHRGEGGGVFGAPSMLRLTLLRRVTSCSNMVSRSEALRLDHSSWRGVWEVRVEYGEGRIGKGRMGVG